MADPNWNNGFYYDGLPPHTGMKLARRGYFFFILTFIKPVEQRLLPSLIVLVQNGINALVVKHVLRLIPLSSVRIFS